MLRLVLVRGLPGSGKSTMAREMGELGLRHFETDQFFVDSKGVYRFDATKLGKAHQWCQDAVKAHLDAGGKAVVSNTFTQKWEALPYLDMVDPSEVEILVATGDWGNTHGVPPESIQRMKDRWEKF